MSTWRSTVPPVKNRGFLVSTTIRSKYERQDFLGVPGCVDKEKQILFLLLFESWFASI